MKIIPYILSFFIFALPAAAQSSLVCDDGSPLQQSISSGGGVSVQAPGSLTSTFISNNGFAGNTFDITPMVDLEITGLDFNGSNLSGLQYNIDVYYKVGTSVGFEADPLAWTLLASGLSDPCSGTNIPTNVNLAGNGMVLSAGVTYGVYFDSVDYATGGGISYTNGTGANEIYSNMDLLLECKTGQGSPAFSGTTFTPRVWNGTIYYDTLSGGGLYYSITNMVAGQVANFSITGAVPGTNVIVGYSLAGPGPINTQYGMVDMTPPIRTLTVLPADGSGAAVFSMNVPANASGRTLYTQALNQGLLSNSRAELVL
jgi:hypothetical protein